MDHDLISEDIRLLVQDAPVPTSEKSPSAIEPKGDESPLGRSGRIEAEGDDFDIELPIPNPFFAEEPIPGETDNQGWFPHNLMHEKDRVKGGWKIQTTKDQEFFKRKATWKKNWPKVLAEIEEWMNGKVGEEPLPEEPTRGLLGSVVIPKTEDQTKDDYFEDEGENYEEDEFEDEEFEVDAAALEDLAEVIVDDAWVEGGAVFFGDPWAPQMRRDGRTEAEVLKDRVVRFLEGSPMAGEITQKQALILSFSAYGLRRLRNPEFLKTLKKGFFFMIGKELPEEDIKAEGRTVPDEENATGI